MSVPFACGGCLGFALAEGNLSVLDLHSLSINLFMYTFALRRSSASSAAFPVPAQQASSARPWPPYLPLAAAPHPRARPRPPLRLRFVSTALLAVGPWRPFWTRSGVMSKDSCHFATAREGLSFNLQIQMKQITITFFFFAFSGTGGGAGGAACKGDECVWSRSEEMVVRQAQDPPCKS